MLKRGRCPGDKKVSQGFSHANSGLGITITCLLFPVMAIYFVCDCHEVLLDHLVPQKDYVLGTMEGLLHWSVFIVVDKREDSWLVFMTYHWLSGEPCSSGGLCFMVNPTSPIMKWKLKVKVWLFMEASHLILSFRVTSAIFLHFFKKCFFMPYFYVFFL